MSPTGATGPAPTGIGSGFAAAMNTARADNARVAAHLEQTAGAPSSLANETQKAPKPMTEVIADGGAAPKFPMGDIALAHAQTGFRVFPVHTMRGDACSCGGAKGCKAAKHPIGALVPHGVSDASSDPAIIAVWWRQMPDANIGIATGKVSSVIVLDVDGPTGEATLAALESQHGALLPTWQVKTGKGRHLYFRYPNDVDKVKSVAHQKLGLDVRADGGYVLGPPSLHASGKRYTVASNDPIADCPPWIIAYSNGTLKPPPRTEPNSVPDVFQGQQPAPAFANLDPQADSLAQGTRTNTAPQPHNEAEEARVRSALKCIPAVERDTWLAIGLALHSLAWGGKGFQIWTDWARTCPEKFDEANQQKTWESFDRPYSGPRITLGTLFHKAREAGWADSPREFKFRTDLGNAKRLVSRHGDNIRYVPEWRTWLVWRNERWAIDTDGAVMRLVKETVEAMYSEAMALPKEDQEKRDNLLGHAIHSQAEQRLKAMLKLAETEARVVTAARHLDADPWLLGVQNGVIELKTGQFRETRRDDLITKRANVIFDANARCPEWLKFLDTITGRDCALQAYMQRVTGYTLTGTVSEEVLFVLYGTGNNGKSTFRETLHAFFGDYALAADAGLLTEKQKSGGATEEIARLKGRRFVAINETAENDNLNEARVKFITSQDTLTARNLYGHLFDFFPTHKAFVTTNHKPVVKGVDEGIWRRLQLIPFLVTFPKSQVEKGFRERRLMPELAGILNWALVGLTDYLKQGLNPPPVVRDATQNYRSSMDVIGQWLDDRCDKVPGATIPTGLVYGDYNRWAEDEIGWTLKKLTFRRHLADRGFGARKGSGGQRMIEGLRLKCFSAQPSTGAATGGRPADDCTASDDHINHVQMQETARAHALLDRRFAGPTGGTGPHLH